MTVHLLNGDAFQIPLRDETVQCCITSPPFWGLRDYGVEGQLGLEPTPEQYVANLVAVFREVRRVLRPDGTVFLNLGSSYRDKQLMGIPHRVVFALQADGWRWRSALPWIKKNAMPESMTDRPTTAHEYWFLLSKSKSYFYDAEAVRQPHKRLSINRWGHGGEDTINTKYSKSKPDTAVGNLRNASNPLHPAGRNRRTSDTFFESLDALIAEQRQYLAHLERVKDRGGFLLDEDGGPLALVYSTKPYKESHFATFNPDMIEPLLLCSTSARGACPTCGAAWRRVVERNKFDRTHDRLYGNGTIPNAHNPSGKTPGSNTRGMPDSNPRTTGWRPQCRCHGTPERGPVTCRKCGGTGRERKTHIGKTDTAYEQGTTANRLSLLRQAARETGREYDSSFTGVETGSPCPACDGSGTVTGDVWPADVDDWPTVPCVVLDPFMGSGTTGMVAIKHRRRFVGLELNREYIGLAQKRTGAVQVRLL